MSIENTPDVILRRRFGGWTNEDEEELARLKKCLQIISDAGRGSKEGKRLRKRMQVRDMLKKDRVGLMDFASKSGALKLIAELLMDKEAMESSEATRFAEEIVDALIEPIEEEVSKGGQRGLHLGQLLTEKEQQALESPENRQRKAVADDIKEGYRSGRGG
jgi:hypothetical protein